MRTYQGIQLPTGVAVVQDSNDQGPRGQIAVMAYIGGRTGNGKPRRQVTKRFNPLQYGSLEACIADAAKWRKGAAAKWPRSRFSIPIA